MLGHSKICSTEKKPWRRIYVWRKETLHKHLRRKFCGVGMSHTAGLNISKLCGLSALAVCLPSYLSQAD
jgi:hypothetical protein